MKPLMGALKTNNKFLSRIGNTDTLLLPDAASVRMTALDATTMAVADSNLNALRTFSYSAPDWSQTGLDTDLTSITQVVVAALDSTDIAFFDLANEELRTYRWDSGAGTWSLVGSGLSITGMANVDIAAMSSTRIALCDGTGGSDELRAYDWNGSNWALKGSALALTGTPGAYELAALSSSRVCAMRSGGDLEAYDFDGTNWSKVGNTSSSDLDTNTDIQGISSTEIIALKAADPVKIYIYSFDGTDWTLNAGIYNMETDGGFGGLSAVCYLSDSLVAAAVSNDDILASFKIVST